MKKFLSVLLSVMMILSSVSFAAPTAVTTSDYAAEPVVYVDDTADEDKAVLAATDTWYDLEKGTLLFNMDFESDNSGSAVSASAYDAISLGSYSAGAGELVSGLGRLNPDVAGNYDMGFRYTQSGSATVAEENGNKYFSVNSSASNQFSLYLGNTFTKAGKYVLEYDYKVTSSATPNYIQYNTPSNGNNIDFVFNEWKSASTVYELTAASNAARLIFYATSNYSANDTLALDNIKVWYFDENVDYDSMFNPPVEVEDTWYDVNKGTLLYNADFEVNNEGKKVSADAVAAATNAGGSFSAASAADIAGLGRLNPDVKDATLYSVGFRYATHNTVTVAKENGNQYMSIAAGTSDNVSFYLGKPFQKAGKYVLELKYKFVPTEGSGKTLSQIDCNTPSNGAVSDVVTGEWGTFTKEYTVTSATDVRLRFMVTGGACASTDTLCFDDIKVWYYDESVDYEEILNPDVETNDVWEDAEKGQKLFTIDFTAKDNKKALDALSWDTIVNRLDNNPTTGELISDLGRINPDVDGSDYRISINYIDNTKTELVTEGENTYLAIAPDSTKGDVSLYLGGFYGEEGTYYIETSYKFVQTGENAITRVRYETLGGIEYKDEASISAGEWVDLSEVHEHASCSHGNVNRTRFTTEGYGNTPYAANDRIYIDNIAVYYKAPVVEEPDDGGDEGEDEPETGKKWYDEELGDLLYEIDFETKNDGSALTASDIALITNGRLDGSNSAGVAVADIAKINPEYADNSFRVGIKDGGTVTLADGILTSTATGTPSFYFRNSYVGKGQYVFVFDYNVSCDASFYANSGYTNGTLTKEEIDSTWMRVTYVIDELNDDNHISADTYASDYLRMMAHRASADGTFVFDNVKVYYKPEGWTPPSTGGGDEGEDEPVSEWDNTEKGYRVFLADFETKNDGTAVISTDVAGITSGRVDSTPATAGIAATSAARVNPEYSSIARLNVKGGAGATIQGTADNQHLTLTSAGDSLILSQLYVGDGTYVIEFDANSTKIPEVRGSYSEGTVPTTQALDGTWTRYTFVSENVTEASSKSCSSYHTDNIRFYFGTAPTMYDNLVLYYQPTGWTPPVVPDEPGEGGEDDEDDGAWLDEEKGNLLYTIDFTTKNDGTAVTASDYASITSGRLDNSPTSAGVPVSNVGRVNPAFSAGYRINFKDAGTSSLLGTDNKYITQNVGSAMSVYLGSFYVGAGRYTVEFDYNTACGATFSVHSGFTSGTLTTEVLDETWTRLTYVIDATEDLSYIRFLSSGPSNESKFTYDNFNVYFKETMLDVTVKANGNANVSDVKIGVDVENGALVGSILANVDLSKSTKKLLGASLTADGAVLTADYVVMPKEVNTLYLIWGGDIVIDPTPWYHEEEYGMLLFDINFDGALATTAQTRWAPITGFGAAVNPEHPLKDFFKSMWGTEDIGGGTTWIPSASSLIVAETDGNRYYTQPHAQTYNEFGFYAPSGGDYALWADAGVFTIKYDIKLSGNISTAQHFVDPNLAKDFAITKADIRLTTPVKANKDGWQTVVYQFDASEFVTQENESLGKLVIYTQTNESAAVENAFICYDNIQVYWKPSKVNVTLKPDTNLEVEETTVSVSTTGVKVSDVLALVNTEDTTLVAKGIRNEDSSVVLGLNDTLMVLSDCTYYIIWEENSWTDDKLGMLIMNGNFEGEWLTTGINRWPEISSLGTSQNPDYSYEGVTGLQYTVSGTGIAFDSEGKWIPADYKKTENLNTYFEFPIGNESYNGEGYTNFNAYAMGKGASQYQYQGAGIYTVSAKIRFPEELGLKHARMSLNAYNGTGIYNVASEDYKNLEAGKWHEISATWVADESTGHGLGTAELYFFYEPTSEKINVAVDDYKIYFKPFTAEVTLRANNNPIANDIVLPDMPTSGFTTEELISHIRTPLAGMELVGLAYDKFGKKMLEGNIVIGGDTRFYMIWEESDLPAEAPVSEVINSLRTDDPAGLRFKSSVAKQYANSATQIGWIITRYDLLEAKDINPYDFFMETDVTKVSAYNKNTDGTYKVFDSDDMSVYITAVLYNIPEKHYGTTLVARAFTVVDGVTYYGYPIENSLCDVAKAIRDDGYYGFSNDQKSYVMNILTVCGEPLEPQLPEDTEE